MKREKKNKLFSLFILLVFALAHIPVALFHQHEHPPECTLFSKSIKSAGEAHYHESENEHCFVCAASVKKDVGILLAHHFNFFVSPFKQYSSADNSLFAVAALVNNSRAPPARS